MIHVPILTAINAATWTAIKLPIPLSNKSNCNPVSVFTSDGTEFYFSNADSGTQATVKADKHLNIECVKADEDGTIMWALASAGTPNIVVLLGVEVKKR